ncbi:MAG: GNAT family N-acetyltransferase [Pseudomonadota bacterium]|nr:GNAT family N-acetyltransferase [Pseudomonadota bacterium]HJO35392.1 GNAT family N-acetyltransferase [Gammaproteobacteria bacterium]
MAEFPIEREEQGEGGRYHACIDGHEVEMTYRLADASTMVIDHTFVAPALRGRQVGEALVARSVADARREGRRIVPVCSFVKAQLARHRDWQDVL